jgi:hypothetical protein
MKILETLKMVSEYLLMPFDIIEENLIPVQKLVIRIDRLFKDYLGIILWAVLLSLFSAIFFFSCSKEPTKCICLQQDGSQINCDTLNAPVPYLPPIDIVCY